MTVIAWDGSTLAADRRAATSGYNYSVKKIFRSACGDYLVGAAGNADKVSAGEHWFNNGREPKDFPGDTDCTLFLLAAHRSGTITRFERNGWPIPMLQTQAAIGSGAEMALATMYLGFTAIRAVEVASALDHGCGNGIDTLTFEE